MPQLDFTLYIYLQFLQYFYILLLFYISSLFLLNNFDFFLKIQSVYKIIKNGYLDRISIVRNILVNVSSLIGGLSKNSKKNSFILFIYRSISNL